MIGLRVIVFQGVMFVCRMIMKVDKDCVPICWCVLQTGCIKVCRTIMSKECLFRKIIIIYILLYFYYRD